MRMLVFSCVTAAFAVAMVPAQAAPILVEVDFSGTGGGSVGAFASSDPQFTVKDPAVTFGAPAFSAIGGGSGTSAWTYDGTGTAAANPDLHTASTFGAPTRFDVDLGLATTGDAYTITSVEIDVRASNSAGTNWDFMYRKASDSSTVIVPGGAIAVQSGADPVTTYVIDVTAEGLIASDAATAWVTSGTGKLRFGFYEANGAVAPSDNLQIDAIRFLGTSTAVPEPMTLIVLGVTLLGVGAAQRKLG